MLRYLAGCLFVLLLGCDSPNANVSNIDDNVVPDYGSWENCIGSTNRICFDGATPFNTNIVIFEFRDKSTEKPELLIVEYFGRSPTAYIDHGAIRSYRIDQIHIRYYIQEQDKWEFSGRGDYERSDRAFVGSAIPLFAPESEFAYRYLELMKKNGKSEQDIVIPTFQFLPDK